MKKIAVVATKKEYADFLTDNVSKFLGRYAEFNSYSIPEVERQGKITEDFVLISAFNIFQQVRKRISSNSEIIVLSLSLSKKQMERLSQIPKGTRALLVNFDNRSCMHTITSMYDAGYRDVELIPYYGEDDYDHDIHVAITPNESHLVPKTIETVYNLGESSVDLNSLMAIADKLGVSEEFSTHEAIEARKEYYYMNSSMDRLLNDTASMTSKLEAMLKLMKDGIVITDELGKIYISNAKARELLQGRTAVLEGFNINEVLPEIDLSSTSETLIRTSGANLIVAPVEIINGDETAGHIVTITDFDEQEEKQHGMRAKLSEADHIAHYHFEDILGESPSIRKTVETAKRMAASDAAVMITGESGTGKEMFAQSIHNASRRSRYNFVAVNCSAIPENLLESEMFGYEEGSFTGARKGGKIGFFELAHKGTIFLDEIGEMPLSLQAKLLRVLEEKKVMRVGSSKNIDIDVRVISATNENLDRMMAEGKFREDLYYRLNVLPLHLPPLRERKEDILPILKSYTNKLNPGMKINSVAQKKLIGHGWRGNVRELRNVAEYLTSLGNLNITEKELPKFHDNTGKPSKPPKMGRPTLIEKFILNEGRDIELYRIILRELKESFGQGERAGRKSLTNQINSNGEMYSEGEVRKALARLSAYGFVRSARGRGGSVITSEGRELLDVIEQLQTEWIIG